MNKINSLLLLVLLSATCCFSQTYINFTPYGANNCGTGAAQGTGYSWLVGECYQFRGVSYLVKYDADNKAAIFYWWNNNQTCGSSQPSVQKTFSLGGCYEVNWADYGWYYNVVNYATPSVVVNPGYIPEYGYRQTIYQPSDTGCQGDYLLYFYYTNDTTYKNTLQTFNFYCDGGNPMETVCTMGSCITTTMYESCSRGDNNDYNYRITC